MNMAQSEREQLMTDIRNGLYTGPTSGLARGYAQANLVVLRKKDAYDFLLFVSEIHNRVHYWM